MASSATNVFKEKVEGLPSLMRIALERQAKARIVVARLEAQIVKLSAQMELEDGNSNGTDYESGDFDLENDLALINLETKIERLKLELAEAEDKAEIEFRASETRVTEGYVKAYLGSNPIVTSLRHKVLDAKEAARIRKVTIQRERQSERLKQQESFILRTNAAPKDDKLSDLRNNLVEANEELILADVEVEVAIASVETYKMLAQLSNQQ